MPDCNWFSFNARDRFCYLFKNCTFLDLETCPDCRSGQQNCEIKKPKCEIQGECEGIPMVNNKTMTATEDCLKLCKNTPTCEWFTFYKEFSDCFLFKSCAKVRSTCESCISGERACRGNCYINTNFLYFNHFYCDIG